MDSQRRDFMHNASYGKIEGLKKLDFGTVVFHSVC